MKRFVALTIGLGFCLSATFATASPHVEVTARAEPISTGRYIAGGVLGTTVGLGIGHAVAGEYGSRGWVFTTGELASLGLIIGGFAKGADASTNGGTSFDGGAAAMMIGGAIAHAVFRIWEVIDVWTRPKVRWGEAEEAVKPSTPKISAGIVPVFTPTTRGAALLVRF